MKELKLADGRDCVVRHGHGSTRAIQTGVFAVEVALGKDSESRGGRRRRADPVQLGDSTAVGALDEKPGRTAAGALTRCSNCGAFRQAPSRRRWWPCWARMRRTCGRR